MKALVVYESYWGNTEAVARAIAEGLGQDVPALHTDEATPEALADADLLVVGAPLMGFSLPREQQRMALASDKKAPHPADVSHPTMRAWLDGIAQNDAAFATFETRFKRSPGSAAGKIARELKKLGYRPVANPEGFLIAGTYGPMRDGEIDRARDWGAALAQSVYAKTVS